MVDISNIYKNLNDNFDKIVNIIVSYYGNEYKEKIIDNLSRTHFYFKSLPKDNYEYICQNKTDIDSSLFLEITGQFFEYDQKEKELNIEIKKELFCFVKNYFKIEGSIIIEKYELFLELIESYIREFDNLKRKEYYVKRFQKYNFNMYDIDYLFINKYNEKIRELNDIKNEFLLENTKYCKNIVNNISIRDPELLKFIVFNTSSTNLKYGEENYEHYIKVPIIKILNMKYVSVDEVIIHEIIHSVESSFKSLGLTYSNSGENNIINEIKTQLFAEDIIRIMRTQNIYLYDEKKQYDNSKYCNYKYFFSYAKIISCFKSLFKYCSINNMPQLLEITFGSNWPIYSERLNNIYDELKKLNDNELLINIALYFDEFKILTNKMIIYFELIGKTRLLDKINEEKANVFIKK